MTLPPHYAHQVECLRIMRDLKGFMVAADAGTGKTRVLIEDAAYYAQSIDGPAPAVVVIAPNGVHDEVWPHELALFWPDHLLPYQLHVYASGEGKRRTEQRELLLSRAGTNTVGILCLHAEALSHQSGLNALLRYCKEAALTSRPVVFILDEIHVFKSPGAIRTKNLTKIVHQYAARTRGASGTLIGKGHEDLFATYRLIDRTLLSRTFTGFKSLYCIERLIGNRFRKIVGYQNVDALYEKIAPITFRVKLEECLDLPKRLLITRTVAMEDAQSDLQAALVSKYTADIANTQVTATEATERLLRLAQVANGYVRSDDGVIRWLGSKKPDALVQLLDEYADPKVIVWCRFRYDVDLIGKKLDAAGVRWMRHDGTMTQDARASTLEAWRAPESARVLVATMKTLGVGRTLNEATLAVFYSLDFDHILYTQTLARNYRAGQQRPVVVVTLSARGSADEAIALNLSRKDAMQAPIDQLSQALRLLSTGTTP